MRRSQPGRPQETRHETLAHGRGEGIPLGRVLAPANRHDSPLLAPTLDKLGEIGPLPEDITVHLDAGYDSQKTRNELESHGLAGDIAHKGDKAPIQAGQRWHVERTNAWHNNFNRLRRCYERTRTSSTRSSTSPTRSSRSAGSSARHGPATDGPAARPGDHDHPRSARNPATTDTMPQGCMSAGQLLRDVLTGPVQNLMPQCSEISWSWLGPGGGAGGGVSGLATRIPA